MTIRDYVDAAVARRANAPAQKFFAGGRMVVRSYAEFKSRVVRVSVLARDLRLAPGRDNVALMMENCPEWEEIYLGLSSVGFTVVPMDPKLKEGEVSHILGDSGAAAIFAGAKQRDLVAGLAASLPSLRVCVVHGGSPGSASAPSSRCLFFSYAALLDSAHDDADARSWFEHNAPTADTVASLIYTSGTTGAPKGAMLTHGNITSNVNAAVEVEGFRKDDVFLVALPLFHAFSFSFSFMLAIASGGCGCFIRSLKTISEDIRIYRPTTILAVPLMAEKMFARIEEKLSASRMARFLKGAGLGFVVAHSVRAALGGRVRRMAIGGAPTSRRVLQGFAKFGVPAREGYGLTECSPLVAWPGIGVDYRVGTVGPVLPCMQYRIADPDATGAGELCVKGPNVTVGYYRNEEATRKAFDADGYFLTGDIVRADDAGNISICGRSKALIVNREGKNIYPEEIEQLLSRSELVAESLALGYRVRGETGEHVGLIVQPNDETCATLGKTPEERDYVLRDIVLSLCRKNLADYKVPRKVVFRHEPFALTSTMKVRRAEYIGSLDE
ncbi:MAG: AMP-binding protein [Kiritimatiellae bacterium]|nr:AMP-binding protein [Kiritimatiellia bacterium]